MLFFKYEGESALRGHGGALELKLPVDKKVSIGLRQMGSSTDGLFDGWALRRMEDSRRPVYSHPMATLIFDFAIAKL